MLRRLLFLRSAQPLSALPNKDVTGLVIDWSINSDSALNLLHTFPELRWLHVVKTGVDHLPQKELSQRDIQVTCSKGAYARAVAEFATGLVYMCAKKYIGHHTDPSRSMPLWSKSLHGQNVLVLGTGHIGSEIALLAAGNGMTPLGVNSDGRQVSGFTHTCSWESATEPAAMSSFIIDCLPLTPRTRHIVGADFFSVLPAGSTYINVGRFETVDLVALYAALQSGRLAQAVLDTEAGNVRVPKVVRSKLLVTHHSAYATDSSREELTSLLVHNLLSFATGKPLRGNVDLGKGY